MSDYTVICCAHCGSDYTHQGEVVTRKRKREDGAGVRVAVSDRGVAASAELAADSREWVGRRDDVTIRLWCEHCEGTSEIVIHQHKGQTLTFVRPTVTRATGADIRPQERGLS